MTATAQGERQRSRSTGFTLIELMLVVAMIGILSSIGGVAWMRYVKRSRTTEATGHLQKMWTGAMAYYESDHAAANGTMLSRQFPDPGEVEPDCCDPGNPDQRCPGNDPVYQEEPWKSLNYNISAKHLYRPIYVGGFPDATKNLWLESWGDLDCDGTFAKFIRRANVMPSGDIQGYATPAIVNETE